MNFSDKTNLSDAQLCIRTKNGDENAFVELINRYSNIIKYKSLLFFNNSADKDDLFQEGTLSLLNAAFSYDQSRGASFKTYATLCIERHLLSIISFENKKKRIPKKSVVSIDSVADSFNLKSKSIIDPSDYVVEHELICHHKKELKSKLSSFEYDVFNLHIIGYSYKRIATKLNVTEKSVDNALQRIRKKLNPSFMPK